MVVQRVWHPREKSHRQAGSPNSSPAKLGAGGTKQPVQESPDTPQQKHRATGIRVVPPALGAAVNSGCLCPSKITHIYWSINSLSLSPVLPALISLSPHRALKNTTCRGSKPTSPAPVHVGEEDLAFSTSSESRLLSQSRSGAGESTREAQRLVRTGFTKWGYYLNQIRDAKKLEWRVQQDMEATRLEQERDNSRGSSAGGAFLQSLCKASSPSHGWMLFSTGTLWSSPAEQEQGSEADFQCCMQIPSFGIHHHTLAVEHSASPRSTPCTAQTEQLEILPAFISLIWRGDHCLSSRFPAGGGHDTSFALASIKQKIRDGAGAAPVSAPAAQQESRRVPAAPNLSCKTRAGLLPGFAEAEGGILLSREHAENNTVGKRLLGNLTQEQHKCGSCLWPSVVRAA